MLSVPSDAQGDPLRSQFRIYSIATANASYQIGARTKK
jgi:hypothetical protein